MDDKIYLVRKDRRLREDAPWLMNYHSSGCTEILADGKRHEIYTFLWGNHLRDAKVFLDKDEARAIANKAGRCTVIGTKKRGAQI